MDTEIVVTSDGSTAASEALLGAAEQSRLTGVPVRIVYAWQLTAEPAGGASASFWVASAADARARATRWVLDTLGPGASSLRWVLKVVEAPPGQMEATTAPDNVLELSSQPGGSE